MAKDTMELKEKLKAYEQLLEDITKDSVLKIGIVEAGPINNRFKVKTEGDVIISRTDPNLKVKPTDHVVLAKGHIVDILPEEFKDNSDELVDFKKINWSEIGGLHSQVSKIRKELEFPIKYAKQYAAFGLSASTGILLYGPSGCGKTMIAKIIASTLLKTKEVTKKSFIYLKGGELLSKWVGETERQIKEMFDTARRNYDKTGKRSVIFIDEAEAILPVRGSRMSSDVETTIVPAFLSEMDGFSDRNPFVILATNHKERIDQAVLRSGRIDTKVYIGRPDAVESLEIFKIYLGKTKYIGDIDELSRKATSHMLTSTTTKEEVSGALVSRIVDMAIQRAIERAVEKPKSKQGVVEDDLINAINTY